jgi:hypothetical protein
MAVKPILFNTDMVKAILDGRKICTRRVIKHNTEKVLDSPYHMEHSEMEDAWLIRRLCRAPYEPGDILYVRETFIQAAAHTFWYKADDKAWMSKDLLWKPSIHMPKEAARIWLKVTDVRVERLQEMWASDVPKEGICFTKPTTADGMLQAFADLWNSTIKKSDIDRYGWDANPWVWVISFERCEKPEVV